MRFTLTDLQNLNEILAQAAEREILPRFRNLEAGELRQKTSALDLVTAADEAAEKAIRAEVERLFPQALFVGEESSSALMADLPALLRDSELSIIIDPIDGTNNFAWGLPLFGLLAAVVSKGETIAGLIYDPIGSDTSFALRGEGAWTRSKTGRQHDLRVSRPSAIADMIGTASWHSLPEPQRHLLVSNLAKVKACFAYRCAVYEYRLVAAGHTDFSLHAKLMPWDHAAGALLHAEAGGYSALLDGTPYAPTFLSGGILSAPSKDIWQELRQTLLEP